MKKITMFLASFAMANVFAQTTITAWDFEADPLTPSVNNPSPSTGVGACSIVGSLATPSRNNGAPTGCVQVSGTGAWAFGDANPGTSNESSGVQFYVSTAGYQNIIIEFDQRISNGGTRTVRIQYTMNGSAWFNFDADASNTTIGCNGSFDAGRIDQGTTLGAAAGDSWGRRTINFSSISGANDNPDFGVRFVAAHYQTTGEFRRASDASLVATGGTWRFDNVTFSGSVITSAPTISAIPTMLNSFSQIVGTPSAEQTFSLSGSNLTGNVSIDAPTHFEVSLTSGSGFASTLSVPHVAGVIAPTLIYVRLNRPSVGSAAGDIELTSPGAGLVEVEVSGTAVISGSANLYINEFMAQNAATIADENSEFDDWIEIYNPNNFSVNLAGYYVSDDVANPLKYRIPLASTVAEIPANGFLLIWADNQDVQGDLHTNFGLSAAGEAVVLTAPDGTTLVDSYVFGAQTVDVSEGRNGDGNANWVFFTSPTPNSSNIPLTVTDLSVSGFKIFPNPATDFIRFETPSSGYVYGMDGSIKTEFNQQSELNVSNMASGIYLVRLTNGNTTVFNISR